MKKEPKFEKSSNNIEVSSTQKNDEDSNNNIK
jgi:hypothetical protein